MDLTMGIAALSVGMSQARAQQGLDVAVLKTAMDMSAQVESLLAETVNLDPNLGAAVDVLA